MNDLIKRYGISILVVISIFIIYHIYQSYRHFEWVNVKDSNGLSYAIPGWRK